MSSVPPPYDPNQPPPPAAPQYAPQPQYGAPQYPAPNGYYGGPVRPYNVLAIVGFVLTFFVSIAGLIVGIVALGQIRRTGERGHGLALAAIIVSSFFTFIGAIEILFALVSIATNSTN